MPAAAESRHHGPVNPSSLNSFVDFPVARPLLRQCTMTLLSSIVAQDLRLRGKLAETYEKSGTPVGRIYLNPVQLDLPMEYLSDAHLEDKVVLEAMIVVKRVLPLSEHRDDDFPE
jgi:hypothetical protein